MATTPGSCFGVGNRASDCSPGSAGIHYVGQICLQLMSDPLAPAAKWSEYRHAAMMGKKLYFSVFQFTRDLTLIL